MNCKPGDLVYHVGGFSGLRSENLGRIFRVLRFVGKVQGLVGDDRWEIEGTVIYTNEAQGRFARDAYLRPIRPGDISDEEVRDLYKPEPTKEAV